MLRKGADIPPLMFAADELEALVVGTRFVRAFGGKRLGLGASAALLKIEAVLPPELRERSRRTRIYAPELDNRIEASGMIDRLHEAIESCHVLQLEYRDQSGDASLREVEPLCLAFWGGSWTIGGWCRLRGGFRNFRLDRLLACELLPGQFAATPERGFAAYMAAVNAESSTSAPPAPRR